MIETFVLHFAFLVVTLFLVLDFRACEGSGWLRGECCARVRVRVKKGHENNFRHCVIVCACVLRVLCGLSLSLSQL